MASHLPTNISGGENAIVTSTGNGYDDGDMVWGKIESYPWWPGQIYNRMFISHRVKERKQEGDVLVAFFGDNTYGWLDPANLIPFEEHFHEKSREGYSKPFFEAVKEAVDELMRRSSLGIGCRCRNKFNFWPSGIEGYLAFHVRNNEYVPYSISQIRKARDSFRPTDMLSYIQQLSLTPMPTNNQRNTIQFIRNKATVLAYRKSYFKEFDETYFEAFEVVPSRPSLPTEPVAFYPSTVAEDVGLAEKKKKRKKMLNKEIGSTSADLVQASGRASCFLDDQAKEERKRGPFNGVAEIKKKMDVDDKVGKIEKHHLNSGESAERKCIDSKYTKTRFDDSKVLSGQNKVLNPTRLILRFPPNASLPSNMQLNARLACFGKLNPLATRVRHHSSECWVVYDFKEDAEAALKHCIENGVLFNKSIAKYYIREEATEAPKVSQPVLRICGEPLQHQAKPKSCRKTPAGDRTWKGFRGRSHIRFALGEGESSKSGGSRSSFAVDGTSENLPSFGPQPNIASSCPTQFRSNPPAHVRNPIDISKQMLDLLKKCSDVVENVKEDLGDMPYHPL